MGTVFLAGKYKATPVAMADGQTPEVQTDAYGRLLIVSGAIMTGGGITYTDKTIATLAGSSETLAAANTSRKVLIIQNTGNANIGVRIFNAGTAAIGGAATITLASGSSPLVLSGAECPTSAVTVIGTAGQPVFCVEGV